MNLVINNHNVVEIIFVTYILSFILVFISEKIAHHINALDIPNERKVHTKPMPRLGGIAIYGAFLCGYMFYGVINDQMISILIASFVLFILGLIDDIKPLRARDKLIVQIIVSCIVVFYGKLYFDNISIFGMTLYFGTFINQLLAIFLIVATINAINLIDGLDGLCAGVSSIYFLTIAILAYILDRMQGLDVILCLISLGSTLGFLTHNFPPAKTFMGDCGSTFLGFIIAVIALLGFKTTAITSLAIPIIILSIPIFDTLLAILRRTLKHKRFDEPDKEHLHHQLLKMKYSPRKTVLIIYIITILFSITSILSVIGDNNLAICIYFMLIIVLLYIVINTDILFEHKKGRKKHNE